MYPTTSIARALLAAAVATGFAVISGCSIDHAETSRADTGSISIPLLATVGNSRYRLEAVFVIQGPRGTTTLTTTGDEEVVSTSLPAGAYSASVQSFTLYKDDGSGTFRPVTATLTSGAQSFSILAETTTTISFQFETDGTIVPIGPGTLDITFGVNEKSAPNPACAAVTIDAQARSVESDRLHLDFSNNVAQNPEALDVLTWAGGQNLTASVAPDACIGGLVAHFGNAWAPPDPQDGGLVLVGGGTQGTWEADGSSVLIHSIASDCGPSTSTPVETRYRFAAAPGADTMQVARQFDFTNTRFTEPFRPFIPRLTGDFDRVLHPDATGTALRSENIYDCPLGCERADWDGSWFAYVASSGPNAGHGMIVLRRPSPFAARLWIDNDAGFVGTNSSSVLLEPPGCGFTGNVSESEVFCFFDPTNWSPSDQAALKLPAGCALDLGCYASADDTDLSRAP